MSGELFHFSGVAGAGVSALAQFHVMGGGRATGSDRTFDRGGAPDLRAKLEVLGVTIVPQDGAGPRGKPAAVVTSTAIEDDNADLATARELGVEIVHRADMLARHVGSHRAIAVAGTSGKSTVAAMIYEILAAAGKEPSVITGGGLLALEKTGLIGNAWRGKSDLLVVEADESDGTVVKYQPWLGVLLNIDKDHQDIPDLVTMFRKFQRASKAFIVQKGKRHLELFERDSETFALGHGAVTVLGTHLLLGPASSSFSVDEVPFHLPTPGRHNVENALAAVAACRKAGVSLEAAADALSSFQGVARRFQSLGEARGVSVVDDFAHNPVKVKAAIETAHLRAKRVLAVFQPHGYAPTRFNRREFVEAFAAALAKKDVLWLPEIYYAGGTAKKTISSEDLVIELKAAGKDARYFADRDEAAKDVVASARSGDCVLVMGARDMTLADFARDILKTLGEVRETS